MAFRVRILPRAELDAQQILDWIKERSPEGARRWWEAYKKARAQIQIAPLSYPLGPEAVQSDRDVRHVLFKTPHGKYYRLLFIVIKNDVHILRVRGPGQPDLAADELE
jgi:plasmid stabilization system protein ParE